MGFSQDAMATRV